METNELSNYVLLMTLLFMLISFIDLLTIFSEKLMRMDSYGKAAHYLSTSSFAVRLTACCILVKLTKINQTA